jgi:8-oxo-dGTP pyrophosphatase MutT (NUDIX family)
MISIDFNGTRFNYRVAGVMLRGNKVLLHKEGRDLRWYLPGGRCELMETSADTLAREFMEEANATVEVKRLLWVIENFYEAHGEQSHELGLYYLVESSDIDTSEEFEGIEINGNTLYFRWFDIDKLEDVNVLPPMLKTALKNLSNDVRHFVNKEI